MNCSVCDKEFGFTWTDTHGVGVCIHCGNPYRIFHYENNIFVDKPPSELLNSKEIELAKEYWTKYHRMVFPGEYDMGISNEKTTHSGATYEDAEQFYQWLKEKETK